uniref:Fibronectin type-III domain-containing protein n=1 Tax=Macrostomum lignano TaxID=282301 RepID=A0A1I8FMW2_9PLAT
RRGKVPAKEALPSVSSKTGPISLVAWTKNEFRRFSLACRWPWWSSVLPSAWLSTVCERGAPVQMNHSNSG